MKKYIDAEKLVCDIDGSECLDTERDYEEVARRIDECEAADVEEVRHGEWIKQPISQELCGVEYYRCSLCNWAAPIRTNYCPNCGAKMDGKEQKNGQD